MAGVTVGVVALPLALAFGITTGLGASAGLITAIVAGLVAAAFGGPKPRGEHTAAVAWRAVRSSFSVGSLETLALVGLVAAVMVLLPRLHRSIPASLVAVVVATLLAATTGWDVATIGRLPSS